MMHERANDRIAGCEFTAAGGGSAAAPAEPSVTFDREGGRIVIEGCMEVGSSNCRAVALDSAEYDGEADALTVTVYNRKTESHPDNAGTGFCNEDMGTEGFRVVVEVDGRLPGTVTVTERYEEDDRVVSVSSVAANNPECLDGPDAAAGRDAVGG